MYDDDPSGSLVTRHSLGLYRQNQFVTTNDILRFCGISTMLKAPILGQVPSPEIGIVGLPYDGGVVRTPGSRFGPRGIRAACWRAPDYHPQFDISLAGCQSVVNDTKPESVFVFVPAGEQPAAIMKTFAERSLTRAGSKKGTAPHRILPPRGTTYRGRGREMLVKLANNRTPASGWCQSGTRLRERLKIQGEIE